MNNRQFNEDLLRDIQDKQRLFLRYAKQEGLFDRVRIGFVDTGWTTRSHAAMLGFLQRSGISVERLFLIAVLTSTSQLPTEQINTFLFNSSTVQGYRTETICYSREIETFLMCDHGRTLDFKEQNGHVEPCFDDVDNADFLTNFFSAYRSGVLLFVRQILANTDAGFSAVGPAMIAEGILKRFWCTPSREEAIHWSQMSWEWDHLGETRHVLARPYGVSDLLRAFLTRQYPCKRPQFWRGAAVQLTPWPTHVALKAAILSGKLTFSAVRPIASGIQFIAPNTFDRIYAKLLAIIRNAI